MVTPSAELGAILSLPEFEERARACMSHMAYEYVASGAADEHTLRWNRERYDEIRLRPRVLVDVGNVSTATSLRATLPFPILLAPTAPLWFQLYVQSDREFTRDVVRRAEDAGCKALCLTVDTPVLGARDCMVRAKFQMPPGFATPHLFDISTHARGAISTPCRRQSTHSRTSPTASRGAYLCSSTAAFAAAPMCSRRSHSARTPS